MCRSRPERVPDVGHLELIPLLHPVVVGGILEYQGQDPEVDEVPLVDPGEAQGQHGPGPEEARGQGRVLAARALPVVLPGDDEVALPSLGDRPLVVRGIDRLEGEPGDLRDVAAIGQGPRPRRQDLVRRDVVPHLDEHRAAEGAGQRIEVAQRFDVGPFSSGTRSPGAAGGSSIATSILILPGSRKAGYGIPRPRGSVMRPASAEAAAVSGLQRYTWSSFVPERPGKFRGTVRRLIRPLAGAGPIPMQPLQPVW
jgi:hypothetical protein